MNSTFSFALAAEHRADLLREVAHDRRARSAVVGGPAPRHLRVKVRRSG
jgi:hypothetical protein